MIAPQSGPMCRKALAARAYAALAPGDLDLCALAAAAYDVLPTGQVIGSRSEPMCREASVALDWQDCRVIVHGTVAAVRGTVPDVMANWLRDFEVAGELCRKHPLLGRCASGALDAAEALVDLLPAGVDCVTGHSLGGQIGVLLAALLHLDGKEVRLVTWDAPKAGGVDLAACVEALDIRQYQFRGSVVTHWPLLLDQHVREPLIATLPWTVDPVEAHSIQRALLWLREGRTAP
jgi:hypothetical protein